MIGTDTISRVIGQDVYDESGDKIGSAAEVYLDDETGQPEWVTVRTGLFGTKESFVPIRERRPHRRRRPRTRQQGPGEGRPEDRHRRPPLAAGGAGALPLLRHRRAAPTTGTTTDDDRTTGDRPTDTGTATGPDDRRQRARHRRPRHLRPDHRQRHDPLRGAPQRGHPLARRSAAPACASTSSPRTSPRPCPCPREEVRVEREPITDANVGNAMDGPAISEEEHEVDAPRRAPGRGEGGRAGRARPPGQGDRHRAGARSPRASARRRSRSTARRRPTATGASEHRDPRLTTAAGRRPGLDRPPYSTSTAAAGRGPALDRPPLCAQVGCSHAVSEPTVQPIAAAELPADFAGPDELAAALEGTGYLPDEGLATAAYLALVMHRPLFLEGEAGVGKTALAHALAQVTGRPIYRLQCYEGLEASQALYDWDFGRQLLHLRAAEAAHATDDPERLEASLYDRRFLLARPAAAGARGLAQRAARRRGRPGRRRVRGVPARGALRLHDLDPRARHDPRASTPPLVVLTSNRTREVHDALKRRCLYHWLQHPDFDREVAILRRRLPEVTEQLAREVARATAKLRTLDLLKPPGIAEAMDWATALHTLGARDLDPDLAARTLGAVLKYREDTDRVHALARGALFGG